MRSIITIIVLGILVFQKVLSQPEPTAAADIQTFFLTGDELGRIENSVNLFTGEVNLPISLISIPGRGGLNAGVTLMYNSNVEEIVDTWNLEAPTGVLGLGWSMEIPKIVVDNKMTAARDDDEFYLVEGGVSNRLYCVKINADGTRKYEPEKFVKWNIVYDRSNERWTIIKEDGMTYIYGDDDLNGGSAVEYIIHWDNWIGNSSNHSSTITKRQGLVWNLARIENRWGDAMTFEYKKVERPIKNYKSVKHTESSYLSKITDPIGRTINFIDMPKEPREYQDPHTEKEETDSSDGTGGSSGDAFQERYEKRYLGNIEVKDADNSLIYSFQFIYEVPNDGAMTKRLLKSIVQKNKDGATFPSIDFSYKTGGNKKGALEKVTYPKGGEVVYHYNETGVDLAYSDRDLTIACDDPGYGEPQFWIGGDYVAVAWRQYNGSSHDPTGKIVKLYIYTWDGGWKKTFRQTFTNVEVDDVTRELKNFYVVVKEDYFGVLTHNTSHQLANIFLSHKDKQNSNGWNWDNYYSIPVGRDKPLFFGGDDFVAIGKREDGYLYTYNWDGENWRSKTLKSLTGGYYHGNGTNNYIIYHDEVGRDGHPDVIYFFYMDEEGVWHEKSVPSSFYFQSLGPSYWHPSNSFSLVMADNNPEYIYIWDENYNITNRFDVLGGYNDLSKVKILNNNMVAIATNGPSKAKVARFDGVNWIAADEIKSYYNSSFDNYFSFGEDILFWPRVNRDLDSKRFNANTGTWSSGLYVDGNNDLLNAVQGNIYYDKNIYMRNCDETWSSVPIYSLPAGHDPNHAHFSSNGHNLFAYEYSNDVYVFWEKSGNIAQGNNTETIYNQSIFHGSSFLRSKDFVVGNTIVTFPDAFFRLEDATQIKLHRLIKNGVSGTIKEYPVKGIEINSGGDTKYIEINCDADFGLYSEATKGGMYNKIVVTHKDKSTGSGNFGSTEYYFINGLSSSESVEQFPSGGNAISKYKLLTGQLYLKRAFEGNSVVSEEKTAWEVTTRDVLNSSGHQIGLSYFVRPDNTKIIRDNITITKNYSYDSSTGNLVSTTTTNSEGKIVMEDYYYLHEITNADYDFAEAENLYASIVQTKKIVGGVTLDADVVDWTTDETVNYPKENYVWDGTGTFSDFSFGSSTHTNWRKVSTVTDVDNYGNVIETRDEINDTYHAKIMGYDHSLPVGIVNNATYAQSFIDVFDDENLTKWTGVGDSDGDTNWSVYDEQLKLVNHASASSGECDRLYLNLGTEVTSVVVFEFDVTIANSNNWDLTIGLGGDGWATGNGGTENAVWTAINDETWYYYAGAWNTIKSGLTVGKKYHFKIVARPSANKADFYVDGVKYISDGNFRSFSSGIQKAAFGNYGYGTVTTTWYLDNVRLYPSNADIVSYDYKPLIGKTSETDINNQKVTYSYDLFDRLETVHDGNGNILEHIEYSFKGNGAIGTDPPMLNASPTSLSPTYTSGSTNVAITSNINWATSISSGDEKWLSVNPVSGSNNGSITINYTQNEFSVSRSGTVTLAGEGLTKTINVTQEGDDKYINTFPNTLYLFPGKETKELNITANVSWNITIQYLHDNNWLKVIPYNGTGNATVIVTSQKVPHSFQVWEAILKIEEDGGGVYNQVFVIFDNTMLPPQ